MISYKPLWKTMENQNATTYTLRFKEHIGGGTVQRLRNNLPVSTHTIDVLCKILKCRVEDIMVFIDEEAQE